MTLPDLINHFMEGGSYESFCKTARLDSDAEALTIYMPRPFGLNSKLEFFTLNETAGKSPFDYNGSEFYNLFDFYYFLNVVKEAQRNPLITDVDLALKLLDQAERDA